MKIVSKIQEKYRERNKIIFTLDFLFKIVASYFAIRMIFTSVSGLASSTSSTENTNLLLFGMVFSLGLSYIIEMIEMQMKKEKKYFNFLLIATIFVFSASIYILVLEYMK